MNNIELQEKLQHTKTESIKELKNVKLLPVIAVAKNSYQTEEDSLEMMDNDYSSMPLFWHEYVNTCFKKANIDKSLAVEPQSPYVHIDNISYKNLELVLKRHYKDFFKTGDDIPEYTLVYKSIEGGYILTSENKSCILPGSMGTLAEIKYWLEALEENTTEEQELDKAAILAKKFNNESDTKDIMAEAKKRKDWRFIYTGTHPRYYKYVNSYIYFTECNVFHKMDVHECKIEYKIRKEEFREAVETAYKKLLHFNNELDLLVSKYTKDNSKFGKFIKQLISDHKKAINFK